MKESLKEKLTRYTVAIPKVATAYIRYAIGDKANDEQQEFRKSQCESCILLTYKDGTHRCNPNMLAPVDFKNQDDLVSLETVKKAGFTTIKPQGVLTAAIIDNKTYRRGCGCPLSGDGAKWKFSFDEQDLQRQDGTAPCPLNRWTNQEYEKWKLSKNMQNNPKE